MNDYSILIDFLNSLDPEFQTQLVEAVKSLFTEVAPGIKNTIYVIAGLFGIDKLGGLFVSTSLKRKLNKEIKEKKVNEDTLEAVVDNVFKGLSGITDDLQVAMKPLIELVTKSLNQQSVIQQALAVILSGQPMDTETANAVISMFKDSTDGVTEFATTLEKLLKQRIETNNAIKEAIPKEE